MKCGTLNVSRWPTPWTWQTATSRHRARAAAAGQEPGHVVEHDLYWALAGQEVYRQAVAHMTRSAREVLRKAGRTVDEIDRFVAHQANQRILDRVAEQLGVPEDGRISNVATVGNTGAASIPLALADACRDETLRCGHRLLATSFGGGLTWGSALMSWPELDVVATEY